MSNEEGEGVSASSALDKDVFMSEPTALLPPKKRYIQTEAPVSSSLSSQKDIDLEMAQQTLGSSSQQGESIELGPSAKAICTELNTESHFQFLIKRNA